MSITNILTKKISKLSAGSIFCANDFYSLGSKGAIDITFHRLAKAGVIRRLGFGLYDKPLKSPLLGDLTPSVDSIIKAYSKRTGQIITMDPLSAANALNLTTQVPAQMTFLTNGKSHVMQICGLTLKLVHASPKMLAGADTPVAIIIQALRYYGSNDMPDKDLKALVGRLSDKDIRTLQSLRNSTLQQITTKIDRIVSHATVH
ncbi:MAG: hypothetical protein KBB83_05390 [Alphaproteobacteria bacterium]|nr:hypothetical protein [Alphaproteobacteria bacterium]